MMEIATVAMNPTVDVALEVDRVVHTHKIRGRNELHAPGGGGLDVARMFVRRGGKCPLLQEWNSVVLWDAGD